MRRGKRSSSRKFSLVAKYSSPGIPSFTGSAPAAIRKWRPSRTSSSTLIVFRPVNRACPCKVSIPLSAYIRSCFPGTGSVKPRLNAISSGQSTFSFPATPRVRMRDAKSTASAPEISIFFGSHPRSAQVPPNGRKSITATLQPAARTRIAAVIAAVPVPTITRSYVFPIPYVRIQMGAACFPVMSSTSAAPASAGTSPTRTSRKRSSRRDWAGATPRNGRTHSRTDRRRWASFPAWRSRIVDKSERIGGSARSRLRLRRKARIRRGFRQRAHARLGVVEGDDGLLFLEAHAHVGDARHPRQRFLDGDRAGFAVHRRHVERDRLRFRERRRDEAGKRDYRQKLEDSHRSSFFNKKAVRYRGRRGRRAATPPRSRSRSGSFA